MNTATATTQQTLQPYLFFNGRCEEALAFYRETLGAEIEMLMRFKDAPEPGNCGPVNPDAVMHASIRIGDAAFMASDGCPGESQAFQGFALSLAVPSEAVADRRFDALAKTGTVVMPLNKTFFSPRFGMVTDRFGITWMIIVPAPAA